MEEQLATIVAMMEDQGRRQEQFAEEQRERHETLILEQGRLSEEGALRQRRTDEQLELLGSELNSVKEALHAWIGAAVESIECLQEAQVLRDPGVTFGGGADSGATNSDTKSSPGTILTKTGLRPTALEFVPGTCSGPEVQGVEATVGGASLTRPIQRPAFYDGRTTWDAYHAQFEMLAEVNGWTIQEKATFLAVNLKGPALTVLSNLPQEQRYDYAALVGALEARFGTAHQAELNRMRLKNRVRRREEGLPELAEDVERLARLAYPGASPPMLEVLAKDQFVDALPDEDMRLRIRQSRPSSLRATLEAALELESYQLASRQRSKPVREVVVAHGGQNRSERQSTATRPEAGDAATQLEEVARTLQQCVERLTSTQAPRGRPRRPNKTLVCWECGEKGHRRRDCKSRSGGDTTADVPPSGAVGNQGNGQQPDSRG